MQLPPAAASTRYARIAGEGVDMTPDAISPGHRAAAAGICAPHGCHMSLLETPQEVIDAGRARGVDPCADAGR